MDMWLRLLMWKERDRLLSCKQPLSESAWDSKRGINFLFSFHLSASHWNVTPNLKHGLSHPYQYSLPLHFGHIISPGFPSDRLLAVGDCFLFASKGEEGVAENWLVRCRKLTNFQDDRKTFCSKYLLLRLFPTDIEHTLSNPEDAGFTIPLNKGMLWLILKK